MQQAILGSLNRGIPVALVKKQKPAPDIPEVPRPPWMKKQKGPASDEIRVVSLRQLASMLS